MKISITPAAATHITGLRTAHGKPVRLRISSGGCQGFLKQWLLDDGPTGDEEQMVLLEGSLVVDQASADLIAPAIIDLHEDLSGSALTVSPADASSTCGCGASFSI